MGGGSHNAGSTPTRSRNAWPRIRAHTREQAVEQKLGLSLPGPFDHVVLVVEECYRVGTDCAFAAYAYVNHWLSLFKGDNFKYPAVQMHELGECKPLSKSMGSNV